MQGHSCRLPKHRGVLVVGSATRLIFQFSIFSWFDYFEPHDQNSCIGSKSHQSRHPYRPLKDPWGNSRLIGYPTAKRIDWISSGQVASSHCWNVAGSSRSQLGRVSMGGWPCEKGNSQLGQLELIRDSRRLNEMGGLLSPLIHLKTRANPLKRYITR